MSYSESRMSREESRVYDTRHPPYSRSNSSSQVPNCCTISEVSHAWQGFDESGDTAMNGSYCVSQHMTSDVIRGQKFNLVECIGTPGETYDPRMDKVHCVKKVRLSQEAETPKYDGENMPFIDFVEDFLRCAQYNCWDETDTLFHLWYSIVGHAKICVKTMPYPSKLGSFLEELFAVFHSERRIEAYRDQLANVERIQNMDLETYGYYLLDLARKAYPLARSLEQERIAKEAFFRTAGSNNLHVWLTAHNPKTLKASIDIAIHFEEAMEDYRGMSQSVLHGSAPEKGTADSVNCVLTLEEQLESLAAELKGLQDLLRFGSSGPVQACSGCDCDQSMQPVNQLQSLITEVRTFGESLKSLTMEAGIKPSCCEGLSGACKSHSSDLPKPYVCHICNRAFKAKRSLKAHCETAHETRFQGFECPKTDCPRTFHSLHKGLFKAHLRVGHGFSVGEVKGILQGVKLKLVANPSAQDIKVALDAPGVIRDPQISALRVKDQVRRSRRRSKRKHSSKPKVPSPQYLNVPAVTMASVSLKEVTGKVNRVTSSSEIQKDPTCCLGPTCGDLINFREVLPSEVEPPDFVGLSENFNFQ